ncbi:hypothetical protein CR513_16344, partial [Mucuna pruriens]
MTRERSVFQDLIPKSSRWITFGGNQKRSIVGIGKLGKHLFPFIENVLYVEGLKHNLLRMTQLCDSGYDICYVTIELFQLLNHLNCYTLIYLDQPKMIILDKHELCFLPTKTGLLKCSLYFINIFKMKKTLIIKSNHGEEFENKHFQRFFEESGILCNFSTLKT